MIVRWGLSGHFARFTHRRLPRRDRGVARPFQHEAQRIDQHPLKIGQFARVVAHLARREVVVQAPCRQRARGLADVPLHGM